MAGVSLDGDEEALSLNVMPLLDIFSILILFLLMSFSADPISYDVTQDVEVPVSMTLRSLDEMPQVSITKTNLKVGDKPITSIIDGEMPESVMQQGAIQPLYDELAILAANNKRIRKSKGESDSENGEDEPNPDALTIEVDKNQKYKLLRRVMLSAQQAEFIAFKLMASKSSK